MKIKRTKKWLQLFVICMLLSATIFCKEDVVSANEIQQHIAAELYLEEVESTKTSELEYFTENGINYILHEDGSVSDEMQGLSYVYDTEAKTYTATVQWSNTKNIIVADTIRGKKVTTIGSMNGADVETIKLGKYVKTIEEQAFRYVSSLKTVVLSEATTTIGKEAFVNSGLESIVITKNVKSIGEGAFSYCKNLTKVDIKSEKLTKIPKYCFAYSEGLKEITLPANVTTLGTGAFSNCTGLEKVVIKGKVKTIPEECFHATTSLKSIKLPDTLTKINKSAFGYSGLEKLTIPSKVTTIGDYAFTGCASLKSINLPKALTKIGASAFSSSGLETVIIPAKVTSIGDWAFNDCKSLKTLTIKASIKELNGYGFTNCTALEELNISGTVKTINQSAFSNCTSLEQLNISGKVTTIEGFAFAECTSLEEINISGTVKTIEGYVFQGCTSLKKVDISGTVKTIKDYAFRNCKKLTQVICSKKVKEITSRAFIDCNPCLTVVAPKESNVYRVFYEGNTVSVTDSEDIQFNLNTGLMIVGESKQICAYNYPGTLKWKSSNSSILKITAKGKATAKKAGSVTLTATCGNQKFTLKMQVLNRTKENVMRVIYSEYVRPEMSDYEKVVAANKWLVQNVKYDYDNYLNNTIPWASYTADGAFVNGAAVCNGYALAFMEIMNHYEIPCIKVTSRAMNHAWDAVYINGHWYHVDVTWNDPIVNGSNENTNVYTDYLLVSDNEIKDHYGYDFSCNTSKRSKVDRTYRTESVAANTPVTEKPAVNPYLNAVRTTLAVGGDTFKLKITGTKAVKFTSSNKKVATVTSKGVIKAKKAGTATIKVKGADGKTYSCKVKVENPKLNKTKLSLTAGKSYTLKVKNTKQTVEWKTSNSKIATVSAKGKVMAVGAGKAKITAEVNGKKMTCTVTVHAHTYKAKVTKKATCTSDGVKTYTCSCGDSYKETIESLGHNYQWIITKQASETAAESVSDFGTRALECENCKDVKQTQNIINMGTRMIYGYFDDETADDYRDRINKYRREEVYEVDSTGNRVLSPMPELREDTKLVLEIQMDVAKYIVGDSDGWTDKSYIFSTYNDEKTVEAVWDNFYRKTLIRNADITRIGTCCFHYDSNGDGEVDKLYWGLLVE